jgi:hypothetical protein
MRRPCLATRRTHGWQPKKISPTLTIEESPSAARKNQCAEKSGRALDAAPRGRRSGQGSLWPGPCPLRALRTGSGSTRCATALVLRPCTPPSLDPPLGKEPLGQVAGHGGRDKVHWRARPTRVGAGMKRPKCVPAADRQRVHADLAPVLISVSQHVLQAVRPATAAPHERWPDANGHHRVQSAPLPRPGSRRSPRGCSRQPVP